MAQGIQYSNAHRIQLLIALAAPPLAPLSNSPQLRTNTNTTPSPSTPQLNTAHNTANHTQQTPPPNTSHADIYTTQVTNTKTKTSIKTIIIAYIIACIMACNKQICKHNSISLYRLYQDTCLGIVYTMKYCCVCISVYCMP